MLIVTSKYYWQTVFVLTLVNSPERYEALEVRKEKVLIKHESA